jgi:hypothetical protein
MAPGTLAVFKAAGHQFGAPASLCLVFSRFGARGHAPFMAADTTEKLVTASAQNHQQPVQQESCCD